MAVAKIYNTNTGQWEPAIIGKEGPQGIPGPSAITTQGDLAVGDASGDPVRLAIGTSGQVLTSTGTTAIWSNIPGMPTTLKGTGNYSLNLPAGNYIVESGTTATINEIAIEAKRQLIEYGSGITDAFIGATPVLRATPSSSTPLYTVAKGTNDAYYAFTWSTDYYNGYITVFKSTDKINWSTRFSIAGGNNIFYDRGKISDGVYYFRDAGGNGNPQRFWLFDLNNDSVTTYLTGAGSDSTRIVNVGYNGSLIVVVYADGTIRTSSDGNMWTNRANPISAAFSQLKYYNGRWIGIRAGVGSITTYGVTSTDGITWTAITGPAIYTGALQYENNTWIITGYGGPGGTTATGELVYSTNGTTWTNGGNNNLGGTASGTFGENVSYIDGAWYWPSSDGIFKTTNFSNWTKISSINASGGRIYKFDGVLYSSRPSGGYILSADNGQTWIEAIPAATENLTGGSENSTLVYDDGLEIVGTTGSVFGIGYLPKGLDYIQILPVTITTPNT